MIWDTKIVTIGRSRNLKRAFPVMLAASAECIGTNTKGVIKIGLTEGDKRVKSIKDESK